MMYIFHLILTPYTRMCDYRNETKKKKTTWEFNMKEVAYVK